MKSRLLQDHVTLLDRSLPFLELLRGSSAFANDLFEGAVYWRNLGKRALESDARVNYPKLAQEEKANLARLSARLSEQVTTEGKSLKEYAEVLAIADRLLGEVATIPLSEVGYLGFLAVVRSEFRFLQDKYTLRIRTQEPTCIRYSSDSVYIEFQPSMDPILSCSFGPDDDRNLSFWVDDLLYLYGDERYRLIRKNPPFHTRDDVHVWFVLLADIWKQYGDEVLTNGPGVFERMAVAQASRDEELARTEGRSQT